MFPVTLVYTLFSSKYETEIIDSDSEWLFWSLACRLAIGVQISLFKFWLQILSRCQLLGQVKKNGEKTGDDTESKEELSADPLAAAEPVPNGASVAGSLSTSVARGPLNSHQSTKRTASGDSVTKPPPGKKKKV